MERMKKLFERSEDYNETLPFPLLLFNDAERPNSSSGFPSNLQSTTGPPTASTRDDFSDSYKMAAEVAVGAAIVVALAILLALIWNQLKRQLPDAGTDSQGRRYSLDSFERIVENRLRDRPPPYSIDQDKPPSYEEAFNDFSRLPSFAEAREGRDNHGSTHPILNGNNSSPARGATFNNSVTASASPLNDRRTTEISDAACTSGFIRSVSMSVERANSSASEDDVVMLHL